MSCYLFLKVPVLCLYKKQPYQRSGKVFAIQLTATPTTFYQECTRYDKHKPSQAQKAPHRMGR